MKIVRYFLVALDNMAQNKLRTSLTLLGLIVGISSVLLMTGLGRGYQQVNAEMLSRLLPNKLTLRQGFSRSSSAASLTLRDADLLRSVIGSSAIAAVAPSLQLNNLDIKGFAADGQRPQLIATSADYAKMTAFSFTNGRFFSTKEATDQQLVIVLNEAFLSALTADKGASPNTVTIANKRFHIVGVVEDLNTRGGSGYPQAYLPISLLPYPLYADSLTLEQGSLILSDIGILTTDVASVDQAQQDIEMLMRLSHGLRADAANDFSINADSNFLTVVEDSSRIFTLVLGGIGAISLLVGGIGIMNIMLSTITERTREIGIRKAVGAKHFDILLQFLIEAVAICLSGALMGVVLSYGLGILITRLLQQNNVNNMRILIDMESVLIASVCGIAAGVIFGLYPAIRAMKLDPIQALHAE